MTVAICVWPGCEAEPTTRVNVPLCDHHAAVTYRRVGELMTALAPLTPPPGPFQGSGRAQRNALDQQGVVYFAKVGELVKIGFTTSIAQRMTQIRADKVLATMPGTRRDEQAMHHRFGHAWAHGEYFHPCPEITDLINTLSPTGQTTPV